MGAHDKYREAQWVFASLFSYGGVFVSHFRFLATFVVLSITLAMFGVGERINLGVSCLILLFAAVNVFAGGATANTDVFKGIRRYYDPGYHKMFGTKGQNTHRDEYLIIVEPQLPRSEQAKTMKNLISLAEKADGPVATCASPEAELLMYCTVSLTPSGLSNVERALKDKVRIVRDSAFEVDKYWKHACGFESMHQDKEVYRKRVKRELPLRSDDNMLSHIRNTAIDSGSIWPYAPDNGRASEYPGPEDLEGILSKLKKKPKTLVFIAGTGVANINYLSEMGLVTFFFNFTDDNSPFEEGCPSLGIGTKAVFRVLSRIRNYEDTLFFSLKIVNKGGLTRPSWILNAVNHLIKIVTSPGNDTISVAYFTSVFADPRLSNIKAEFDALGRYGVAVVTHPGSHDPSGLTCKQYYPSMLPNSIVAAHPQDHEQYKNLPDYCIDIRYSAKLFEEVSFVNTRKLRSKLYNYQYVPAAEILALLARSAEIVDSARFKSAISDTGESKEFLLGLIAALLE